MIGSSYVAPLQLANWPVKLGAESQLFVDDYLIHSMAGIVRVPHQPRKDDDNPILVADRPWEGDHLLANGTIVFNPDARRYHMYYNGSHLVAFSNDGLTWTKPSLGIVEYEGSRDNNVVFGFSNPTDLSSFVYDPRDPDPARRWKAAIYHYDRGDNPRWAKNGGQYGERSGLYAFYSRDGLHWSGDGEMIIPGRRGRLAGSTWPLTGVDDVSTVTWDAKLGKFAAWVKVWDLAGGRYYRARAMALSDDFVHWSQPWTVLLPDKTDPPDLQLYGFTGWPYESLWLGLVRTWHSETGDRPVDFQLASSRDGIHWERALGRACFLPNGPDGSYDHGYHNDFSNPPLRIGDELVFYYASTAHGKGAGSVASDARTGICRARMRVDGFASLRADGKDPAGGFVITRPLDFSGSELHLNATASRDPIQVEVLAGDEAHDLQPIAGFGAAECERVAGDGIDQVVSWRRKRGLEQLGGRRIRLKFHLRGTAALYSFWIR